jgi:two-component system C4-dicarboxylate transport sensor histidine kinase DctB
VGILAGLLGAPRPAAVRPPDKRGAPEAAAPSTSNHASAGPPKLGLSERTTTPNALAKAHARFARAALGIYLATAAVSVVLLMITLATDKEHDEAQIREQILLQTDARAHSLSQRLALLGEELRRLSERSEVDLRDQDLAPEKSLLQATHERSAFFNVGVAILDKRGEVVWSEPLAFLERGASFAHESWFGSVRRAHTSRIVPVQPDRPDSVLYVVSPLIKGAEFTGALLGAVDLARGQPLAPEKPTSKVLTLVVTTQGEVVYPPVPPGFASERNWHALFARHVETPFTRSIELEGVRAVVASSPVMGSELVLMLVGNEGELFRAEQARLRNRLLAGLVLALTPALLLLLLLRRSLQLFQRSEQEAVREERLRLLGEAANSIAHEVKNALNGLSMGLDLVVRASAAPGETVKPLFAPWMHLGAHQHLGAPSSRPSSPTSARGPINAERRERIVGELRREIQRLSEFTTELMTFSRGVEPRRSKLDLTEFLPKVTGLLHDSAEELGAAIELQAPAGPVWVEADGALLHAVVSNLAGNALDAAVADAPAPRVEVRVEVHGTTVELRVSDNGPGVSESMKPRLFEPFQTEKANGVGIGLALARKIARAHGGELALDELAPVRPEFPGASFVLTLPLLLPDPRELEDA